MDWTLLLTSSFSKPSVFCSFTSKHKNLHAGDRIQKPPWIQKTPFTCGQKAKTKEETSVFKNIRMCANEAVQLKRFSTAAHAGNRPYA